ncbi:N-acetylmuramoyl-L-alanine amidase [Moheibacter sediminis]|uniref:SH3 domain-containing protein n=1 Tax=Moheibacter sediminis TaxID=1434700 RepID=A0A1W1ZF42_9FLAO|nr:SH3 domain-containing protein [Moheibacter sediminis]SMC46741.1 SH3 domain-containing protein [Moheibacter sediminis]
METKLGFTKMNISEFRTYISQLRIARTILTIQQHHTYIPSYIHFKGNNHFELQRGMKNTHINQNGLADIGQHFSIFPDGEILTGRSLEKSPACIYGNNANSICIENVGYFDKGHDEMTDAQKEAVIVVTAALCEKFNFTPDTNKIVYHHWFNLATGKRNNGSGNNKSCPGTNFFDGNKVEDCEKNFIPLVKKAIEKEEEIISVIRYAYVTASTLNIRIGAGTRYALATDRSAALFGAILRVYQEKDGWYKISSSASHWVSVKYTKEVRRAIVNTDDLNIRSGIGTKFPIVAKLMKGQEVFVYEEKSGWVKIDLEQKWVNKKYISE